MAGDDPLKEAVKDREPPHIADEDEKSDKRQQQAVVHAPEYGPVRQQQPGSREDESQPVGENPRHREQRQDEEQEVRGELGLLVRKPDLFSKGNFDRAVTAPRLHRAPDHDQNQGGQRIGQHQPEEGPQGEARLSVQIQILRVPYGRQHAAQIGGDRLQDHDGDQQAFPGLRPRQVQDDEGEGYKGDERHVVRDGHAGKEAEQDEDPCQLPRLFDPAQQRLGHPLEDAGPLQSGHHAHQAEQDGQGTEIDIGRISRVRMDEEHGYRRQRERGAQHGLLLDKINGLFFHLRSPCLCSGPPAASLRLQRIFSSPRGYSRIRTSKEVIKFAGCPSTN